MEQIKSVYKEDSALVKRAAFPMIPERKKKRFIFCYGIYSIIFLYYCIFRYWPISMGIVISFKDMMIGSTIENAPWVGWENFRYIFSTPSIWQTIINTIRISFLRLVFGFLPPIILAIFLNDLSSQRFKRSCQTIVYLPHFFSWVIMYGIVFALFSSGYGFFNNLRSNIGLERINFLLDTKSWLAILIGSAIWKEIGWGTIIYLAALTAVDPNLYDAAKIDGSGPWRRIYHIAIPSILPVISFMLTLSLGNILNAGFEQVLLFYNSAVYPVADIIDTWVYRVGLGRLQYSVGAAMGIFKALIGMILIIASNSISKKYTGRGIW